jgi:uncharacterized protein (DUF1330 family)
MSAYYLFDNVEVRDPAALAGYAKEAAKVVAEHGGRYVVLDAVPEVVEGVNPGLRSVVLMEFPDRASGRAWYDAPAYQPLKEIRHRAVLNNAVLLGG